MKSPLLAHSLNVAGAPAQTSARPTIRRWRGTRGTQHGLSLIGLLVVATAIIMVVLVALRIIPSALEFMAVRSAVEKVASSGSTAARDLQVAFDRYAAVDDITAITGRDLIIERVDDGVSISFAYEKRIPMFGPVSVVIDYNGSSRKH